MTSPEHTRRMQAEISYPHELVGVDVWETDAATIIEAARRRLASLRANAGSEVAVTRHLLWVISAARDAMLEAARDAAQQPG